MGLFLWVFYCRNCKRFYKKFYKHAWWISLILLVLVKIVGKNINGSQRWIYLTDTLSFQPSELVKILMIVFYAGILAKNRDELKEYNKGFLKHMCLLAPIIGL